MTVSKGTAFLGSILAVSAWSSDSATAHPDRPATVRTSSEADDDRRPTEATHGRSLDVRARSGEPLADSSGTHRITNERDVSVDWYALASDSWVRIDGPANGTLAPGESTEIRYSVDPDSIPRLGVGMHRARLSVVGIGAQELDADVPVTFTIQAALVDGWTVFTPSADTRRVYVSSSTGNDANSGLSEAAPKRTIEAGMDLMRHGYPDWLLLKKGDFFAPADLPDAGLKWETSGRSASEPTLLSSYGPANAPRPRLVTRGMPAFRMTGGGQAPPIIEHVSIVGLEMIAGRNNTNLDGPTGIRLQMPLRNILIEDCRISRFAIGITAQINGSTIQNLAVRRCVINDCFTSDGSHAQGVYVDEVDGFLLEENVIDHGGWSENDPGTDPPDIFKHNVYVQGDARNVTVRGNMLLSASSHGVQVRSGGIVENNLFARNAIGLLMAGDGTVRRNVFLDGRDISPSLQRRQAMHVQNVPNGATISENVFGVSTPASSSKSISLLPLDEGSAVFGVRNAAFTGNVFCGWGGEIIDIRAFSASTAPLVNVDFNQNDFQNFVDAQELIQHQGTYTTGPVDMAGNRFHSAQAPTNAWARVGSTNYSLSSYLALIGDTTSSAVPVNYPDRNRTIATYNASLGGPANHAAFVAQALRQSKALWRPEYTAQAVNAYVRAGFGLAP